MRPYSRILITGLQGGAEQLAEKTRRHRHSEEPQATKNLALP
jgi:hypothetical protein